MKKEIKNKRVPAGMLIDLGSGTEVVRGVAIITNDSHGKTLSLTYGRKQMTIAFEQVEKYLKD